MGTTAQAGGQGLDRTGAKHQHRDKQGQHQQGEQDTAACGVLQELMQNHVAHGGMVVFTSHQAVHLASGDNRSHRLGRA